MEGKVFRYIEEKIRIPAKVKLLSLFILRIIMANR
jgi:hypothetical protein